MLEADEADDFALPRKSEKKKSERKKPASASVIMDSPAIIPDSSDIVDSPVIIDPTAPVEP